MSEATDFDAFVDAVQDTGLGSDGASVVNAEAIPLTHTSAVTPKDWERVQKTLNNE
jgi:hypothetical protein